MGLVWWDINKIYLYRNETVGTRGTSLRKHFGGGRIKQLDPGLAAHL